jgi:hypothetical protein
VTNALYRSSFLIYYLRSRSHVAGLVAVQETCLKIRMSKHSWRCVILVGTISAVCYAQSLRQETDQAGMLVGTAVRPTLFSETAYAKTLASEFNMVEPEDAMKWRA